MPNETEKAKGTMPEARASWTMRYVSRDGFDMMLTLRDEDEAALSERVARVVAGVLKAGGRPQHEMHIPAADGNAEERKEGNEANEKEEGKTYIDENGVRRCNRRTREGRRCGAVVTQREGKYGTFWSCPRYKEHAK